MHKISIIYLRRWIYLTSVILGYSVVFLISCASYPNALVPTLTNPPNAIASATVPTKPPPPVDWPSRWLKGIPCRPPCWEGITPGKTTPAEAVEILRSSPLVANAKMATDPLLSSLGYVIWDWVGGRAGGEANYSTQALTQTLYIIGPYLSTSFRFQDVIQAYGEPSHILATAAHGPDIGSGISYYLQLVYLPQGFALAAGGSRKPALSEDMFLNGPSFFAPTTEGFIAAFGEAGIAAGLLTPWQGIRSFDFYCKDQENGSACRGED